MKRFLLFISILIALAGAGPKLTIATLYDPVFAAALTKVHAAQPFKVKVVLASFQSELDQIRRTSDKEPSRLSSIATANKILGDSTMSKVTKALKIDSLNTAYTAWQAQELPTLNTHFPIHVPNFVETLTLSEQAALLGVIEFDVKE